MVGPLPYYAQGEFALKSTGKSHWERFHAAVAAGNDAQAEALLTLLSADDTPRLLHMATQGGDEGWWGVRGLAQVGDAQAIPVVVVHLGDEDASVRAVAALALASLSQRYPDQVRPFLACLVDLLTDDDGLVRQSATDSLAQYGDGAVEMLAVALDSPHEGVRVRVATALHRIGTLAAARPLYHHLEDASPLVRHYAFETLDRLGLLTNVILKK